ncbi:MAG: CDP-diacylglycerol--serine O-phosphatidyltransferase [Acidobacteriia bacterium]|nr:CDP-diacylglycerol--serine O-phosphatidyltransferase [Terriglobia bacterium]
MSLELPERKPKFQRQGPFRRGIYILPSLFTVGTLVCGYYAVLSTLRGSQLLAAGIGAGLSLVSLDNAAKAIGWAVLFDGLDGRIARLTNSTSDFGREFDSLADVIAFGIAPAFLAYAWGVRSLEVVSGTQLVQHIRQIGWIVTFTFVICGAARLARFNIDTTKGLGDRRYFVGLPIPAAAGVVAALVHWAKDPVNDWTFGVGWLGVVAILSFLMVSRLRYPSFKTLDLRRRRPYVAIILIGLVVWAIWAFSEPVLLTIALTYGLSGPVARLTSRFRPHPPAPEEVHAS